MLPSLRKHNSLCFPFHIKSIIGQRGYCSLGSRTQVSVIASQHRAVLFDQQEQGFSSSQRRRNRRAHAKKKGSKWAPDYGMSRFVHRHEQSQRDKKNHQARLDGIDPGTAEGQRQMKTRAWEKLGLSAHLCHRIHNKTPTIIQQEAIPMLGRPWDKVKKNYVPMGDVIIQDATGTGKTLAYALPILENIDNYSNMTQAIIIAPSVELAHQITQVFKEYSQGGKRKRRMHPVRVEQATGSINPYMLQHTLHSLPHVVVATPDVIYSLLFELHHLNLSDIQYCVLDEADTLLRPRYREHMKEIVEAVQEERERRTQVYNEEIQEGEEREEREERESVGHLESKIDLEDGLNGTDNSESNASNSSICDGAEAHGGDGDGSKGWSGPLPYVDDYVDKDDINTDEDDIIALATKRSSSAGSSSSSAALVPLQVALVSATITPEVRQFADTILTKNYQFATSLGHYNKDIQRLKGLTPPQMLKELSRNALPKIRSIRHYYFNCGSNNRHRLLPELVLDLLIDARQRSTLKGIIDPAFPHTVLVFFNRWIAQEIQFLVDCLKKEYNLRVGLLSKYSSRSERREAMKKHVDVIFSDDTLSRGIDLPYLVGVVNYHMPTNTNVYQHRAGRVGRIGSQHSTCNNVINFCNINVGEKDELAKYSKTLDFQVEKLILRQGKLVGLPPQSDMSRGQKRRAIAAERRRQQVLDAAKGAKMTKEEWRTLNGLRVKNI